MISCDERFTFEQLSDDEQSRVQAYQDKSGLKFLEMARSQEGLIVPTLINGSAVDRAKWQEVVRIGGRSCTGTIVGRNCVLTAAHCGRNRERNVLEVYKSDGSLEPINYTMFHHPRWRNQSNWDVALLVLEKNVPSEVTPAKAGIDHTFTNGQDVDILGYGCTRPGGGGGNDGILRFGESKVQGRTGTDIITSWRPSGGALCFGDSGGPMMANGSDTASQRTLIAINSKGNIRDTNYNMPLNHTEVADWLRQMADQYDLEIVGVTSEPDEPEPPTPPAPGVDLNLVWSEAAKSARQTASTFEEIAERYEAMIEAPTTPPADNGGSGQTFGL